MPNNRIKIIDGKKPCNICKATKPVSEFGKDARLYSGYKGQCKSCTEAARAPGQKAYRATPEAREKKRVSHRIRLYGVDPAEYNRMFQEQQGCCAICGKHQSSLKRALDVDHNHKTSIVRGLLCRWCNVALGRLDADSGTSLLKKAIEYLEK